MSEAKFTKGEWDWEHDVNTSSIIRVFSNSHQDNDICRLQSENNASLISAAPEMYEMLDKIMKYQVRNNGDVNEYLDNSVCYINELLAKARGE